MIRNLASRTSSRISGRRCFSTQLGLQPFLEPHDTKLPADFRFFPAFLDEPEQRILLQFALHKLDVVGSREGRRKRKLKPIVDTGVSGVNDLFLPDENYDFEEGHYDGVIMRFRETHVSSWPPDSALETILLRLRSLLPTPLVTQTHLLHLASNGYILPHVDNINASGPWIAAVSLGGERILRMETEVEPEKSFEILLPSGSAYVQRNTVRYSYKHSIRPGGVKFKSRVVPALQRVSVMMRDHVQTSLKG